MSSSGCLGCAPALCPPLGSCRVPSEGLGAAAYVPGPDPALSRGGRLAASPLPVAATLGGGQLSEPSGAGNGSLTPGGLALPRAAPCAPSRAGGRASPGWFWSLRGLRAHKCVCFCCNKLFSRPPPMGTAGWATGMSPRMLVPAELQGPIPRGLILLLPLGAQCRAAGGRRVLASRWLWLHKQRVRAG